MAINRATLLSFAAAITFALSYAGIVASPNFFDNVNQRAFAQEVFVATNMTGAKEVPPVKTMATGTASFLNNQTVIDYDLSVSDLYNATARSYTSGKGRS